MVGDERLIDEDPASSEEDKTSFFKSKTFLLILKISLAVGLISSVVTGLIITNMRLSEVEAEITDQILATERIDNQQSTLVQNIKALKTQLDQTTAKIDTLNLSAARGQLNKTLEILQRQSKNIDVQLATSRNGLLSLSRMVKGSRVWQEDYRNQFQQLFDENQTLKTEIERLRGVYSAPKEEPEFLEMEF